MRYAVISDIHSNPIALSSVLADIRTQCVDRVLCCGDIVGYHAMPNESVSLMRNSSVFSIAGNHDLAVTGVEKDLSQFWYVAAKAIRWTKNEISAENMLFLKNLPRTTVLEDRLLLFHGVPTNVSFPEMQRLNDVAHAARTFRDISSSFPRVQIAFFGHIHAAKVYVNDGEKTLEETVTDSPLQLSNSNRYIVNPGSVCLSRDSDTRSSYVIYDTGANVLTFHKLEIDDLGVRQATKRAGLYESRSHRAARRLIDRVRNLMRRLIAT